MQWLVLDPGPEANCEEALELSGNETDAGSDMVVLQRGEGGRGGGLLDKKKMQIPLARCMNNFMWFEGTAANSTMTVFLWPGWQLPGLSGMSATVLFDVALSHASLKQGSELCCRLKLFGPDGVDSTPRSDLGKLGTASAKSWLRCFWALKCDKLEMASA